MPSDDLGCDDFCPACGGLRPDYPSPTGFEKVVDFENVGLIIYRRIRNSENVSRDKRASNMSNLKTVIVHNTSETDITSGDFLREMQKREITCQRCRQIIELALQLLHKVPAINQKAIMGICDRCKLKDPCRDCNETTNNFRNKYEGSENKWRLAESRNKWKSEIKKKSAARKYVKQDRLSESGLYMKEFLRQEYAKAERDLDINDLCSPVPLSSKSLPTTAIDKDKKHLLFDEPLIKMLSSESNVVIQEEDEKISFAPEHFEDSDNNNRKSTYSPSKQRQNELLQPSKEYTIDTDKIVTDDNIITEPLPGQKQKKEYKYYEDDNDIFPKYPKAYLHEREKYVTNYDQKGIDEEYVGTSKKKGTNKKMDDQYLSTIKKVYFRDKKEHDRKPSGEILLNESTDVKEIQSILKKQSKKPTLLPKMYEFERAPKEFSYSFPAEEKKLDNKLGRHKTSLQLIKEIQGILHDRSEELKKQILEKRMQKEEEKEMKRLEKEKIAKMIAEKKLNAEKARIASEEMKLMKNIEVGLIKDDIVAKKLEQKGFNKNQEISLSQPDLDLHTKDKALIKKEKGNKTTMNGEKDFFKNKKITGIKQEKSTNFKLTTDKIGQQNEFGIDDILKDKKKTQSKDAPQLARMKLLPEKKIAPVTTDKKPQKNKNNKSSGVNINKIKASLSQHDEVLVKFKEDSGGLKYTYRGKTLREHWDIHEKCHKILKDPLCPFCLNSDLELNVDLRKQKNARNECIQGDTIVNMNKIHETPDKRPKPLLFHTNYHTPIFELGDNEKKVLASPEKPKIEDHSHTAANGVIHYTLSDRTFIDKGWTVLPTEKVMRKMNVYRMRPAKPEFDWFKRNKNKQQIFYDSGERFSEHEEDGRSRWYYKNQRLALDYYDAEELNAQQRFVIYSNGEPDKCGRPRPYAILAMFDHLGNGVVFDHGGKIRMKYNQTEGVILDKSIGPASHWKWHTLNDPPDLQQVMIDTQLSHKDPRILAMGTRTEEKLAPVLKNEEMLTIEFDNVVKEKSKKLRQDFKPFQIKMKAMQINEHFSLKVLDQANVYLIYRDGTTNIKLNIGMLLDHKEIVDTDTIEVGEVSNNIERLPARTNSLAEMQMSVAHAQRFERTRTDREHNIRPLSPSASVDKLTAALSRALRPPVRVVNSCTTTCSTKSISRKSSSKNVYYCTV